MSAPIRIMHVVDSLGKGGLENGLVNLIERLDPSASSMWSMQFGSLGANTDRLPNDRVRVMCLGKKDTDFPLQVATLARGIRDVGPDVVHCRNWAAVEAVLAGKWVRSCKVVHSEHGLESDANAKEPWRRLWFRRLAFELADQVVSVSYQLRNLNARRIGFPAHKIAVIHNGVDSHSFYPDPVARNRARQVLGVSPDEFCIGSVGNLFPVKDHMTLLKAMKKLAKASMNWRLLVIGEGPEIPRLEAFTSAHPEWRERVSFLGSSDRVAEMLNALDVYVLPSISEGISNPLFEAMATGLPVIATATGGNPEVVLDGDSGILFPVDDSGILADHLLELRERRDLRVQRGQRALRRVKEYFCVDSMVRNHARMFENLVSVAAVPLRAVAGF